MFLTIKYLFTILCNSSLIGSAKTLSDNYTKTFIKCILSLSKDSPTEWFDKLTMTIHDQYGIPVETRLIASLQVVG
mgnify:CR=1 FL=1